jgi:hypothetical protein
MTYSPLLSVRDLRVVFQMATGEIEALHGVNFDIDPGSTVALVGESGSGKSVTAQAVMGILPSSARITSGALVFNDPDTGTQTDIAQFPTQSPVLQAIRGGRISIIFKNQWSHCRRYTLWAIRSVKPCSCIIQPAMRKVWNRPRRCSRWLDFLIPHERFGHTPSSCPVVYGNAP